MENLIDTILFRDLESCDPRDVMARTGCHYDEKTGSYQVWVWGYLYAVMPRECRITARKPGHTLYLDYLHLFILHYLMKASLVPLSGEFISEKDMVGGAAFFRGSHTLPTHLIAQTFDRSMDDFIQRCEALKGTRIVMADAAFSFEITPKIPVAVLFWQGDEDFGCESKLLFDKAIDQHLPLDIIYALAVEVCYGISRSAL